MDLRRLRYFVAVAEELHFSRAAAQLHLAQSALSFQIRALEAEVGGPLLVRSSRQVSLTPAGESLLADARTVLSDAEAALERARALARGEAGSLVVGSVGPATGGLLAPLLSSFNASRPDVRFEVRAITFIEMISSLVDRRVDVALVHLPIDSPELEVTPLLAEPRAVVMSSTHPLRTRAQLSPADLVDERFVTHPSVAPETWRDFWLLVDELGRRPEVSPHLAENVEEWLHLIGRGEGVDTCPATIAEYYSWPEVVFIPLVDAAPARLALVRRRDPEPLTDEFRRLALESAANAIAEPTGPYTAP